LVHLVRNCVDHGIESPETREAQGKPARGMVRIEVSQKEGSEVSLSISDDGSGINVAEVKAAAVRAGSITQEQADCLSRDEAVDLIFKSGISSSRLITDIS